MFDETKPVCRQASFRQTFPSIQTLHVVQGFTQTEYIVLMTLVLHVGFRSKGMFDETKPVYATINYHKAKPAEKAKLLKLIDTEATNLGDRYAQIGEHIQEHAEKYGVTLHDGAHRRYAFICNLSVMWLFFVNSDSEDLAA